MLNTGSRCVTREDINGTLIGYETLEWRPACSLVNLTVEVCDGCDKMITVCDKCLRASCWQGISMCPQSQTAGTTQITVTALQKLNLESACYWKTDDELDKE